MSAPERDYEILRVRLASAAGEGRSRSRLLAIARALAGMDHPDRPMISDSLEDQRVTNFKISPTEILAPETIADLARTLSDIFGRCKDVVLDLGFRWSSHRAGAFDILVSNSLREARANASVDHRILLLLDKPPTDSIDTFPAVAREFDGILLAIDSSGQLLEYAPKKWHPTKAVQQLCQVTNSDLRNAFSGALIRRRGVFRRSSSGPGYAAYRYSVESAVPGLVALLTNYVSEREPDLVLYDPMLTQTLSHQVTGACLHAQVPCLSVRDLEGTRDQLDSRELSVRDRTLSSISRDPNAQIALVVGMRRTGRRVARLIRQVQDVIPGAHIRPLALMVAEDRNSDVPTDKGGFLTMRTTRDGVRISEDFFAVVTYEWLDEADWRVVAGQLLDEVEEAEVPWIRPTRVGFWSLFDELGVEGETPAPLTRPAVAAFPALRRLSSSDALWLAESGIRVAESRLSDNEGRRVTRADIVIVMPDEESGARPLADALGTLLDVSSVSVPRSVIDGHEEPSDRLLRKLRSYGDFQLVLFDESAMSYSPRRNLDRFLALKVGRAADLAITVVEAPTAGEASRPRNLESLYRWTPLRLSARGAAQ
jgi:hypothetical protein